MTGALARPPFDPELQAVLDLLGDQLPVGFTSETIPLARQAAEGDAGVDDVLTEAGVSRRDVTIPGYEGADIVVSVLFRKDHSGLGPGILHTQAAA